MSGVESPGEIEHMDKGGFRVGIGEQEFVVQLQVFLKPHPFPSTRLTFTPIHPCILYCPTEITSDPYMQQNMVH